MSKELSISREFSSLVSYIPEHEKMIQTIADSHGEINRATSLFGKTQSQFMDNMLTVSHLTPLRNIRQILAEMEKIRGALKESYFKCKKKDVEIKQKQRKIDSTNDILEIEMLELEIAELYSHIEATKVYISGAVRKLSAYTEQYNSLLKAHNKENFTEEDFEKEEERYHIMKAFEQALSAARSHGGIVDEGNMIYFTQIGINGTVAQRHITEYLLEEQAILNSGKEPTFNMQLNFLNAVADKFQGSAEKVLKYKGMNKISTNSLLKEGDTRLLENK